MIQREKYRNLSMIFSIDETNIVNRKEIEGLFEVVKKKFELIDKWILQFVNINERSTDKTFLQKAISDNLSFISSNTRIEEFKKQLKLLNRSESSSLRIAIDRFKANEFYEKKVPDKTFNETIFAQFFNALIKEDSTEFLLEVEGKLGTI